MWQDRPVFTHSSLPSSVEEDIYSTFFIACKPGQGPNCYKTLKSKFKHSSIQLWTNWLSPPSKKVQIPRIAGAFLCAVCMFSLCLCWFSLVTTTFYPECLIWFSVIVCQSYDKLHICLGCTPPLACRQLEWVPVLAFVKINQVTGYQWFWTVTYVTFVFNLYLTRFCKIGASRWVIQWAHPAFVPAAPKGKWQPRIVFLKIRSRPLSQGWPAKECSRNF